jgi:uncharacterized protein with NRDE domain
VAPPILGLDELMCLLFISYQTTPGYQLVVAANRDEFLSRPTAPLGFLDKERTILAGLDLQGGGTWLGITAQMKFAAITNFRDPAANRENVPSRGEILLKYLTGTMTAEQYIYQLAERGGQYNGFNLILGDSKNLYYYSNKLDKPQQLAPGFYGLSNQLLDVPWPKVVRGKELLRPFMVEIDQVDPLQLLSILEDGQQPPDDLLPDTGIGLEWERLLSTIFIDGAAYGTRSSAVITVAGNGNIEFVEKTIKRTPKQGMTSQLTRQLMNSHLCPHSR